MALQLRRRRFRPLGKNGQLALALAALALALFIAILWMIVHFHSSGEQPTAENSENASAVQEEFLPEDIANLLVIFRDTEYERFILIQADPAAASIRVAGIPGDLAVSEDSTLVELYRKNSAAAATAAVADTLQLALNHYMAFSGEEAESWFNYLETGISVALPEDVDFTDTNGSFVRLDKGKQPLNATQVVCLLRYAGWKNAETNTTFPATVLAAMINQHLSDNRYLSGDFAQLANLAKTSLRIGDFNDYHAALKHIGSNNTGRVCQVEELYGDTVSDRFVFDHKETQRHTNLY